MTDSPTPNTPLTVDDVKLLRKGDWLVPREGHWPYQDRPAVRFNELESDLVTLIERPDEAFFAGRFTFLGRPDQSGWIPHDGGPNPAPGLDIYYRLGDGFLSITKSDFLYWGHDVSRENRIVAWRPHVPAPAGEDDGTWLGCDCHEQESEAPPQPKGEAAERKQLSEIAKLLAWEPPYQAGLAKRVETILEAKRVTEAALTASQAREARAVEALERAMRFVNRCVDAGEITPDGGENPADLWDVLNASLVTLKETAR